MRTIRAWAISRSLAIGRRHADDRWTQAALTVEGKIANLDVGYAGSYLKRDVDTDQDYSDYSLFYDISYGYTRTTTPA